jgi:hypothetical protein
VEGAILPIKGVFIYKGAPLTYVLFYALMHVLLRQMPPPVLPVLPDRTLDSLVLGSASRMSMRSLKYKDGEG